jgi:MinD superfamily P-loop ATPase
MSGKGGTGKTTVTASFAYLSKADQDRTISLADADVDAANLHLLMQLKRFSKQRYFGGKKAFITSSECNGCGDCVMICRFDAIRVINGRAVINPLFCEGCNACVRFCHRVALRMENVHSGWIRYGKALDIVFSDGELFPGEETSGKLVTEVRKKADELAGWVREAFPIDTWIRVPSSIDFPTARLNLLMVGIQRNAGVLPDLRSRKA